MNAHLAIRLANADDAESMRALRNEIIRVSGTKAITNELSSEQMRDGLSRATTLFRVLWPLILRAQS